MRVFTLGFCLALAAVPVEAKETAVKEVAATLKPGPGVEAVEANCAACHTLSYIQMNSPFLSDTQWDAEIKKMIKVMGAPIGEEDSKAIADYLKKNYGG